MYKWEIRNKYDKDSNGCSVGKNYISPKVFVFRKNGEVI